MQKYLLSVLLFLTTASLVFAQPTGNKADLEKERKEIQDELKEIQGMYNKVKGQTKQSLAQLNMLNRKINLQEKYISSINKELKFIDDDMYLSNLEIYRLKKQLDTLKVEYARTVVYAYKNRSSFDYVNFIFSASSVNDAIRRVSYLKSYRAYREKQVSTINETQDLIAKRQQQQLEKKTQKNVALQSQTKERVVLVDQKKEKDQVVAGLKSQEKDLQKEIGVRKKRDNDLKNAVLAIVRRDIENAKAAEAKNAAARKAEEERNKAAAAVTPTTPNSVAKTPANNNASTSVPKTVAPTVKKTESFLELNATDVALGADFSINRGKLPWPVDNGYVSIPFGRYVIEGTKIVGDNPGITIATASPGSAVKAVFDGEVSAVDSKLGSVFVRHGKYYTIYSNLGGINVSKGTIVKRGQVIGKVGEADEGAGGELNFILMVEKNNVNPASWLRGR